MAATKKHTDAGADLALLDRCEGSVDQLEKGCEQQRLATYEQMETCLERVKELFFCQQKALRATRALATELAALAQVVDHACLKQYLRTQVGWLEERCSGDEVRLSAFEHQLDFDLHFFCQEKADDQDLFEASVQTKNRAKDRKKKRIEKRVEKVRARIEALVGQGTCMNSHILTLSTFSNAALQALAPSAMEPFEPMRMFGELIFATPEIEASIADINKVSARNKKAKR